MVKIGKRLRTKERIGIMINGEVVGGLRARIIVIDNEEGTKGHMLDGRPVVKKEDGWYYIPTK